MKKIKGLAKTKRRKVHMVTVAKNIKEKDILNILEEQSSNDWEKLCSKCSQIVKEARMSEQDIDDIVESVKKENG